MCSLVIGYSLLASVCVVLIDVVVDHVGLPIRMITLMEAFVFLHTLNALTQAMKAKLPRLPGMLVRAEAPKMLAIAGYTLIFRE